MATLTYNGQLPVAEVLGFGHFSPGESKTVDESTAVQFDCEPCKREGWSVEFDGKKKSSGEDEPITKTTEAALRGPRHTASDTD